MLETLTPSLSGGAKEPDSGALNASRTCAQAPDDLRVRAELYAANGWLSTILEQGASVCLHVDGDCMEPRLNHRQRVRIERRRFYLPGDVVVVSRHPHGGLLMHRLLGPVRLGGRWMMMTRADAAHRPDPLAAACQVLGKVVASGDQRHHVPMGVRLESSAAWVRWCLYFSFRRIHRVICNPRRQPVTRPE